MIDGKTVIVTGGTGSFARKFVEVALARYSPKRIIVFSRDELKQHDMALAVRDPRVSFFIGDVRDGERLRRAFQADVDIVVHAAAMKQVPACEYNPFEAIKTNVLGGQNVIDAAIDVGVPRVIALSTDKAVNPVNLYGTSKLAAEKLFVQGNAYAGSRSTRFACVRYGNVVGSRGSVIPLFLEQPRFGQVTLIDERPTRFWLTREQGVDFVINSLGKMRGGEVFVPRILIMSMVDLAKTLALGCKTKVTGIRPGEKLHECLLSSDEARHAVALEDMYVINPEHSFWHLELPEIGTPLPSSFKFSSDSNDRWLTADELLGLAAAA